MTIFLALALLVSMKLLGKWKCTNVTGAMAALPLLEKPAMYVAAMVLSASFALSWQTIKVRW
jgi:hypothetical protein